ncbi:MAG: NapC/NirT family cytochrome c [Acidobacteriaceae bacterium]
MSAFARWKKDWLQPFFYLGNNSITLIGSGLTTASAVTLIFYWIENLLTGRFENPYLGLIFFLTLPGLFIIGLILIPVGMWRRRRTLLRQGGLPEVYPEIHLGDPIFRHGVLVVVAATLINLGIVSVATYRGVAYMDSPTFCGTSCHVMRPQWVAYQSGPHSHVACVECHVGSGMEAYVQAKVNGTKQLIEVTFHTWPAPITAPLNVLRPARATCESCHNPQRFLGERLLVKTTFSNDEKNSVTRTILVLHLGGIEGVSQHRGIHGAHLNGFEYVATDNTDQKIIEVSAPNGHGGRTEWVDSTWKGSIQGVRRTMDCMDCHNQAAHVFQTPEDAMDQAMTNGNPSAALPFVHKEGMMLIQAKYSSQTEASRIIPSELDAFYRTQYPNIWNTQRATVNAAARALVSVYDRNVFPFMKVTWGTYPDNIGHMAYPGCFRCHDGSHVTKTGQTLSNDCSLCHNLLAVDETNPRLLNDLGLQNELRFQ